MSACNCPRPDQCPTCRANESLRAAQDQAGVAIGSANAALLAATQYASAGILPEAQAWVLNQQKPWWRRRTLRDRFRYAWREFRR